MCSVPEGAGVLLGDKARSEAMPWWLGGQNQEEAMWSSVSHLQWAVGDGNGVRAPKHVLGKRPALTVTWS
jgi:hypothetical protein